MERAIERTCKVKAPREQVWERVTTPMGINHELTPWLRMTTPAAARGRTLDQIPTGVKLGRSWVLALGVIPVEYDDITPVEVEPGRRFLERSSTLTLKLWQHERVLESVLDETQVTDRLTFELRWPLSLIPGSSAAVARVVAALFGHRHRRLVAHFAHIATLR